MALWPLGLLYLYCGIIGLCIGSFCNVIVYRVPRGLGIARGRSFCPQCSHTLAAKDLVPLFSWLFLRGKCRYCGGKIPARYPLVELLGGALAVVAPLVFSWRLSALMAFLAGCILMTIAFIDADTQEIPDAMVVALALVAIGAAVLTKDVPIWQRVIGIFVISLPMLLLNLIKPTSFGGGDIKLCAASGFLLGWQNMLVGGFLALLGGGAYGVYLLASKKKGRREHFAFGPFLAAGIYVALLLGDRLIAWYLQLFGI